MLTAKQNMYEAVRGGNPDRVVNQYEAMQLMMHPYMIHCNQLLQPGMENVVNAWGVTNSFPVGVPGAFPVHTPDKIVIKDIEHWQDYVHAPSLKFPDEEWAMFAEQYEQMDSERAYKATFIAPGLFENCHHMGEIAATLVNLFEYPDEMHDLIKYLTDWELEMAEGICSHLHPDMLFHHDDWGSQKSTFMSPAMWEDFFVEPYKQLYGYYHDHGVELVVHHSDSFCEPIVEDMVDIGIDVWQGVLPTNDIVKISKQLDGRMALMGGIDSVIDREDASEEEIRTEVRRCLKEYGEIGNFIPSHTYGGPGTIYPHVEPIIFDEIDEYNKERFGL